MKLKYWALHSLYGDKAPGLDELSFNFFQSCWGVVKEDVIKSVSVFPWS